MVRRYVRSDALAPRWFGRIAVATAIVASATAFIQSAGSAAHPLAASASAAGYSVGITRCTFVDPTRTVPDFATTPPSILSNRRVLVTEIRYPTNDPHSATTENVGAAPASQPGGFPMIVFAHGYDVMPDTYAALLDAWVEKGFVVAAPIFPDENPAEVSRQHNANTEIDMWNEPADLAFVTRQILKDSAALSSGCPLVHQLVRASALALAGHSDGGTVVGMLTNSTGRDPQGVPFRDLRAGLAYRAAIIMSAQEDEVSPYRASPTSPALLVVQSAADQCNPAVRAVRLYRDVHQSDKWFLELLTAHHLPPYDGTDVRAFDMVVGVSTRFLHMTLEGTSTPSSILAFGNLEPSTARTFHAGQGPIIPALTTAPHCGLR